MYGPFLIERLIAYPRLLRRLAASAAAHDELVRLLLALTCLHAFRLAPGRDRRTSTRRLAFTTAQRMIHRVHRHAAHLRTTAAPAHRARLADRAQLVVA